MNSTDYTFGPKRILMTADTLGGVWTYAVELASALKDHRVEIALATMGRRLSKDQRQQTQALGNVTVFESNYKLEWMDNPWLDVEAAGEWLLDLEERVKPDLIHLNGYAHASLSFRAPKLVVGHSCVLSWWRAVHGTDAPAEWNAYREAVAQGLRAADLTIAPSRAMLDALEEHYGPLGASMVIPNGRPAPPLDCSRKEKIILTAGRLWDAAKNVSALAAIAPEVPWPICVAGEEKDPNGRENHFNHVHCLGRLSWEQLSSWYARSAIYALPARYEPFGLSILEAGLAGCALVLGDIPSLREIWHDAALFVPPEDPEVLKDALRELSSSPAWIADLGSKARRVAIGLTPERMAAGYRQAYGQLLEQACSTRARRSTTDERASSDSRPGRAEERSSEAWVEKGFAA